MEHTTSSQHLQGTSQLPVPTAIQNLQGVLRAAFLASDVQLVTTVTSISSLVRCRVNHAVTTSPTVYGVRAQLHVLSTATCERFLI